MSASVDHESKLSPSWSLVPLSWELLRRNVTQAVIFGLLPALLFDLGALLSKSNYRLGGAVLVVSLVWLGVTTPAMYVFQLAAIRGKTVGTSATYLRGLHYFWRLVGYILLMSVLITVGLLALVVPGLIFIRRYILGPYFIVDKDASISEAMRLSAAHTKPVAGKIWGTLGVLTVCSLGASIASSVLFIGLPGGSAIASSIVSLVFIFVMPLRYREVMAAVKPDAS